MSISSATLMLVRIVLVKNFWAASAEKSLIVYEYTPCTRIPECNVSARLRIARA